MFTNYSGHSYRDGYSVLTKERDYVQCQRRAQSSYNGQGL